MTNTLPAEIELLAPARDTATAIAAIDHGADAVYMGGCGFGARSQASNSIADIRKVVDYAHRFGVRVYVTVNTIIYDNELDDVRSLAWDLWKAGVDALIVQDLALTRLEGMPPIALHASTQCDTRTVEKARFLEQCGFTRIVLARELTFQEIGEIRQAVKADLEVFVHGALCVSYSGDCQASYMLTGRSANRGECCQVCRFKFDLEDGNGEKLIAGKHLLSLRDMNRLGNLESLLSAGATSLKIEGRLKDANYVKNVVGAYRRELDRIIAANPGKYRRSSQGSSSLTFTPDVTLSFNRGFTPYFLDGRQPKAGSLATFGSPKWIGKEVGKIIRRSGNGYIADLKERLSNGDGIGYYTADGAFKGFRLNRVEYRGKGDRLSALLFPAQETDIPSGAVIYRNADRERNAMLEGSTAVRKIDVGLRLSWRGGMLVLAMKDDRGIEVEVAEEIEHQQAKSPQLERRRKELGKLGDSIYNAVEIEDECADSFIAASVLSQMRRRAVALLDTARLAAYRRELPGKPAENITLPEGYTITRHDNIANRVAGDFYAKISGIDRSALEMATECGTAKTGERVMQTRYCLRRELGACLRSSDGRKYPSELYLVSEGNRFQLEFDCRNCRMNLIYLGKEQQ